MENQRKSRSTRADLLSLTMALSLLTAMVASCVDDGLDPSLPDLPSTETISTMAAPGSDTVLVVGDWGTGSGEMSRLAAGMEEYSRRNEVGAILTTGDNLYVDDYQKVLDPFSWATSSGIEFWVSWGNHDMETPARVEAMNQAFHHPARWTSASWGEVEILILDSNSVDSEEQISFIEGEMGRIERPTVVAFHHPAYSCSSHGPSDAVTSGWLPMFDEDVVLVVAGHDHNYQRFEEGGVTYLVTGGGGQSLSGLEPCRQGQPPLVAGAEAFHFLAMSQTKQQLEVEVIGIDGALIDSLSIVLEPGP